MLSAVSGIATAGAGPRDPQAASVLAKHSGHSCASRGRPALPVGSRPRQPGAGAGPGLEAR